MIDALLKQIPRGLFEPVAVLGLIGVVLFLFQHQKKDKAETLLWSMSILFMVAWRVMVPIISGRYVLILLPVMILAGVYAIEQVAGFCRRFIPFPRYPFFLGILLVVFCVKSFRDSTEDKMIFSVLEVLKKDALLSKKNVTITADHDVSVFLGDRFEIECVYFPGDFSIGELPQGDYFFFKLDHGQYALDWHEAELTEIIRLECPDGESDFVLWKRKKK